MTPKKPQYSLHKHHPIDYGANKQIVKPSDNIPYLDEKGIDRVQGIVGALLYVGREGNKKFLVLLITIGGHQAEITVETEDAIEQLLDYVATYPEDVILFH